MLLVLILLELTVGECNHLDVVHTTVASFPGPRNQTNPAISCPTWTHPNKTSLSHECICGDSLKGAVECDQDTLKVQLAPYYCISYDGWLNTTIIGNCPYRYYEGELPQNLLELDSNICGEIHRTGQFCGECKEGYYFPVYSYSQACIKCDNFQYGWIKFAVAALLPLTFF